MISPVKLFTKLPKVIPANKFALETWLADPSRNIAVSGLGVALLAAQITELERRCGAMHSRIEIKRAQRECKAVKGQGQAANLAHRLAWGLEMILTPAVASIRQTFPLPHNRQLTRLPSPP
jgi:hypothetical protein